HIRHVDEDHNRRSSVNRWRSTRQGRPFRLDHDHLRTYGQQRMCYRTIGPRPTIEFYGLECPHAEVNLRCRIATDATGNDDGRVFGEFADVAGHGSSAFVW